MSLVILVPASIYGRTGVDVDCDVFVLEAELDDVDENVLAHIMSNFGTETPRCIMQRLLPLLHDP
jgi:hypothetical protein